VTPENAKTQSWVTKTVSEFQVDGLMHRSHSEEPSFRSGAISRGSRLRSPTNTFI